MSLNVKSTTQDTQCVLTSSKCKIYRQCDLSDKNLLEGNTRLKNVQKQLMKMVNSCKQVLRGTHLI